MTTFTIAQSRDPTRTVTLRRSYVRDYNARWQRVEREATNALRESGGVGPGRDYEDEAAFLALLALLMRRHVSGSELWQRPYLRGGYMRGLQLANTDLRRSGLSGLQDPEDVIGTFGHTGELGAIYAQANHDLANIQNVVLAQVGEQLQAARVEGADVGEMVGITSDRVQKIGGTRTTALAKTAVVGAVAAATLNRFADAGVRLVSAVIELQYTTAQDDRVCEICLGLEAQDLGNGPGIYTIEQARGLIPQHPRCRCRWTLVAAGQETPFGVPSIVRMSTTNG